jgi:glycosyltransferase involved in cell wall biosynthesis
LNAPNPTPAVSVIIPAYNAAAFIPETLASVFSQTFSDFEVIVVNDGSPDTPALEKALRPFQDRILYLRQENSGPAGARNRGIRKAKGEFVAFLDSDDAWPPEYLSAQMKMFAEQPALDLVYADGELFGDGPLPRKRFMQTSRPPTDLVGLLSEGSQFIPSGTVVRKKTVEQAGYFDESLRGPEDYDLWLRLAYGGARIAYQPDILFHRRTHPAALTANEHKMVSALVRVFRKLQNAPQLPPEARTLLEKQLFQATGELGLFEGKAALQRHDAQHALEQFQNAYSHFGGWKLRLLLLGLRFAPRWTCRIAAAIQKPARRSGTVPISQTQQTSG